MLNYKKLNFSKLTSIKLIDRDKTESETDKQLKSLGLSHTFKYEGGHTDENDWQHFKWTITLLKDNKQIHSFTYMTGTGHCKVFMDKHQTDWINRLEVYKPTLSSVVWCMVNEWCDTNFLDWCDELGHNPDSIKRANLYHQLCQTTQTLRRAGFPIDRCREILENY